jgi:hypothetical protein
MTDQEEGWMEDEKETGRSEFEGNQRSHLERRFALVKVQSDRFRAIQDVSQLESVFDRLRSISLSCIERPCVRSWRERARSVDSSWNVCGRQRFKAVPALRATLFERLCRIAPIGLLTFASGNHSEFDLLQVSKTDNLMSIGQLFRAFPRHILSLLEAIRANAQMKKRKGTMRSIHLSSFVWNVGVIGVNSH